MKSSTTTDINYLFFSYMGSLLHSVTEGEVTSLSGADKREVRDNREKWWEYREKSKYFSNCTTFHIRRALLWHSHVIMYLLMCRNTYGNRAVEAKCAMLLMRVCNLSITCWISEIVHQLYNSKCLHTNVCQLI
jgi:ABC-type transport system involved in cytochrome bd biosynthesis fused ATPase/permease subunit